MKGIDTMTKRVLKKICFGLFLAIGLTFVLSRNASAGYTAADAEMSVVCDTWQENITDYSDQSHCWSCELFLLLFDASNIVAGQINSTLSKPAMSLVIVGGCLWLAFCTLAYFGNISNPPDPMEYLTKVGSIMLRVGLAGAFLAGGSSLTFNYIINPILASGAQLATQTLKLTNVGGLSLPNDVTGGAGNPIDSITQWIQGNAGRVETKFKGAGAGGPMFKARGGGTSGPMGAGVRSSLKTMIAQMASGMARAQAIAQGLRCGAFFWKKISISVLFFSFECLIPNPAMWAVGAWLGCIFWVVSVMFSFAMLDVIFRIGLLAGLLPVFVAAWTFPITGSFAKTAFEMFLNSVMVFFITAIVAAFIILLLEEAWNTGSSANFNTFVSKMEANSYVEAWDSLFEEGIGTGIGTVFVVSVVAWWAWLMAPKSDKTAEGILGASFSSSVAIKAVYALIGFILDLIMLVITIVTLGAGACVYAIKFARFACKAMQELKKLEEALKKIQEFQKKMKKIKEKAEKVKEKVQKGVDRFVPSGE